MTEVTSVPPAGTLNNDQPFRAMKDAVERSRPATFRGVMMNPDIVPLQKQYRRQSEIYILRSTVSRPPQPAVVRSVVMSATAQNTVAPNNTGRLHTKSGVVRIRLHGEQNRSGAGDNAQGLSARIVRLCRDSAVQELV